MNDEIALSPLPLSPCGGAPAAAGAPDLAVLTLLGGAVPLLLALRWLLPAG